MTFIIKPDRIDNGCDGTQKEILRHFGLKFHRMCKYKYNDEYDILFLNRRDDHWENKLTNNGNTLYETSLDNIELDYNGRQKKRIIFYRDTHNFGTYSFIGVFQLDKTYDWKTDTYPSGKKMDSRLKYDKISDSFTTD